MVSRSFIRLFLPIIAPLVFSLFLAGCLKGRVSPLNYRPPTPDQCDIIRGGIYRDLLDNPRDSTDEIVHWISATLGSTGPNWVRVAPVQGDPDDYAMLNWSRYGRGSSLNARGGEVLVLYDIPLFDNAALAHVLECLGEPDSYSAEYWPGFELSGPQVFMKLYYPAAGEVVFVSVPVPNLQGIDWSIRSTGVVTVMAEAASVGNLFVTKPVSNTEKLLWMYTSRGIRGDNTAEATYRYANALLMMRAWPKDGRVFAFDIIPPGRE